MNSPESTDYPGRGADPYRRDPYDPQFARGQYEPGGYEPTAPGGATDLLDFPPLPQYLSNGPVSDAPPSAAPPLADQSLADRPLADQPVPAPQPAPEGSGLRVSSDAEATARLLIKLPSTPPQPSTTLRPHAPWEDRVGDDVAEGAPGPRRGVAPAAPFAQVAASPARPTALPSELAALTTATLVVPLPRDTRPTPALLTTTLPPDKAAQANAAALANGFSDTLEQVFGLDLEQAHASDVGLDRPADPAVAQDLPHWFREEAGAAATSLDDAPEATIGYVPGVVPSSTFGGRYGVPTQPALFPGFGGYFPDGHDPARHALALRYLGGIFHDSSGESSYLDPGTVAARAFNGAASVLSSGPFTAAPDEPTQQLRRIPAPSAPAPERLAPRHGGAAPDAPAGRGPVLTRGASDAPAPIATAKPGSGKHAPLAAAADYADDDEYSEDDARRGGSRVLTVVAVLAAIFAVLYGLALAVASGVFEGAVPRGIVVAGVPVGGLDPAAARQLLDQRLGGAARAPMPLLIGQQPALLDPVKSGLSLDSASTVQAAQQQRTNPLVVIPALFGATHQIAPVTSVDTAALTRALDSVAASYDSPMVEGAITFHAGVPVVTAPREGRGFSVGGAVDAIRSGYLRISTPIQIPVQALLPKATPVALQDALEAIARPAVSAPIALVTGGVTTHLTPAQIGDALTIVPDAAGRMGARLDGTRLRGYLGRTALAREQPAVDAGFTVSGGRPVLVPARDGSGFAPAALAEAVLPALTAAAPRTAQVPLGPLPAAFGTADAQALGVTDVLGSSTLTVATAPNRIANVRRAAELISGNVVQPGATWSFLDAVGAPTQANGFVVSAAAQRAGVDPSGGVDTVATAVFDAAFASGMGDALHHPHASYIDRYPVGLDAAVVAPSIDLKWTNTGEHPVYLYASYANGSLTVALLGEKSYDAVNVRVSQRTAVVEPSAARGSCAQDAVPGFQVDVTRTLSRGGSQVGAEQFHVSYLPQSGAGCSGASSPDAPSGSVPSHKAGGGSGSAGGGGAGGGGGSTPSSAPSPSPTGILGGLLH